MPDSVKTVVVGRQRQGPENTPRLRLKRKAPVTGYVDGAWWPHGTDLAGELPDLLTVLAVRLGGIARVSYNLNEWSTAPRKVLIDGHLVRLAGYHRQPTGTVSISNPLGHTLVLLVVPPGTHPDFAHTALMTAAETDNVSSVDELLTNAAVN